MLQPAMLSNYKLQLGRQYTKVGKHCFIIYAQHKQLADHNVFLPEQQGDWWNNLLADKINYIQLNSLQQGTVKQTDIFVSIMEPLILKL